jgi:hypothetical protein
MRTAAKRDRNEPEIVAALEAAGYAVQRLSDPGVPDLLVCDDARLWTGAVLKLWLLEVKMPGESLTPTQRKWHAAWPGRVAIVHSPAEALEAVR